jgi:hypothetical protein
MSRIPACAALLLSAGLLLGQQPQNSGENAPTNTQPVTYPGNGSQSQQAQPQANPQEKSGANSQIQSDLQSALNSDPVLSGTDVQVSVDDVNITLTGSVQAQGQMDRVMALTSPYARYRNVVNKIAVH